MGNKKYLILLLLIFIDIKSFGQEIPDSIFIRMYDFLELKGEILESQNSMNCNNLFYIEELITGDTIINTSFGIYKFTTALNEESGSNILIKVNDTIKFYDFNNYQFIISDLTKLVDCYPSYVSNAQFVKYIKKLNQYYELENNSSLRNTVIIKKFGKYCYYISFKNYYNSIVKED